MEGPQRFPSGEPRAFDRHHDMSEAGRLNVVKQEPYPAGGGGLRTEDPFRPLIFPGSQLSLQSLTSTSMPGQSSKFPAVAREKRERSPTRES